VTVQKKITGGIILAFGDNRRFDDPDLADGADNLAIFA
jgi:hypothetical protein